MQFNVLKSSEDTRDFLVEEYPDLPMEFLIPAKMLGAVKDQGKEGACSAFVMSSIKENQERQQIGMRATFEPMFFYTQRAIKTRAGMTPRETFEIALKYGAVPTRYWKSRFNRKNASIPTDVLSIAENFKIDGYARANSIDALKSGIISFGACYIALPVYDSSDLKFWRNHDDVPMVGGHAIAAVGFDKEGFILMNSWGSSWGNGGFTKISYEDFKLIWEAWFIMDAKTVARFKRSGKLITK